MCRIWYIWKNWLSQPTVRKTKIFLSAMIPFSYNIFSNKINMFWIILQLGKLFKIVDFFSNWIFSIKKLIFQRQFLLNNALYSLLFTQAGASEKNRPGIDFGDPTLAYVQCMRFTRRAEGIKAARAVFRKAREDERVTYHVYIAASLMEYYGSKDPNIAHRIFELGLKKYPATAGYVRAYLDFLVHLNGTSDHSFPKRKLINFNWWLPSFL